MKKDGIGNISSTKNQVTIYYIKYLCFEFLYGIGLFASSICNMVSYIFSFLFISFFIISFLFYLHVFHYSFNLLIANHHFSCLYIFSCKFWYIDIIDIFVTDIVPLSLFDLLFTVLFINAILKQSGCKMHFFLSYLVRCPFVFLFVFGCTGLC